MVGIKIIKRKAAKIAVVAIKLKTKRYQ